MRRSKLSLSIDEQENRPALVRHHDPQTYDTTRKFMLFTPWCDQGLGVQGLCYAHWLRQLGFDVMVFSCRPYKTTKQAVNMQADPAEWRPQHVTVHYSEATREHVAPGEVARVAREHKVTDALLLELQHDNVFRIAAALRGAQVRVYGVPNIELVRRPELNRFNAAIFTAILCNNQFTSDTLLYHGISEQKLRRFPFALPATFRPQKAPGGVTTGTTMRFLLVGGMNANSRKQATKVAAAFTKAVRDPSLATLTITCQGIETVPRTTNQAVRIVNRHMSCDEIRHLYTTHHVVFMCSRAEGIGLSMHEALLAGCAVIALNAPLYREMIVPNINGWLVPAHAERGVAGAMLIGNNQPIIPTYGFEEDSLATVIRFMLTSERSVYQCMLNSPIIYEKLYGMVPTLASYRAALAVVDDGLEIQRKKPTGRLNAPNSMWLKKEQKEQEEQ
jgi:hypothetical protein